MTTGQQATHPPARAFLPGDEASAREAEHMVIDVARRELELEQDRAWNALELKTATDLQATQTEDARSAMRFRKFRRNAACVGIVLALLLAACGVFVAIRNAAERQPVYADTAAAKVVGELGRKLDLGRDFDPKPPTR